MANKGRARTLLVAAIDFGTTFSGWAYSLCNDPERIITKTWNGPSLISLKAPTTLLIRPDGKTLEAFGYEADTKYGELTSKNGHMPWYYFSRFKMLLYNEEKIDRGMSIEDVMGKRLNACHVFSLTIRHLKDDLIKTVNKGVVDAMTENEIDWVITVPAIWNDSAKLFMRTAATEAGIKDSRLSFALEPEAASIYCRREGEEQNTSGAFQPGCVYMVVDAGGGTVDIAVHEVKEGG